MAHEHQQDIQAWLGYAAMDLSAAQTLCQYHRPMPCEIICYHCQQAAEKAIKALFIRFDLPGGIPRKHDLSFLLNQLQQEAPVSPRLRRMADVLSVYGIIARYPNEVEIDEARVRQALDFAESILQWAKSQAEA